MIKCLILKLITSVSEYVAAIYIFYVKRCVKHLLRAADWHNKKDLQSSLVEC